MYILYKCIYIYNYIHTHIHIYIYILRLPLAERRLHGVHHDAVVGEEQHLNINVISN